jgi:PBP1b-binding outer membrane lipoprotein LpoB
MKAIKFIIGLLMFFSACSAEAASFSATKKGLPSLVMLSTPT